MVKIPYGLLKIVSWKLCYAVVKEKTAETSEKLLELY